MSVTATVQQALDRYKLGVDAIKKQVEREKDDLRCQVPELMWPDEVRSQRQGQTIGTVVLPPRPMISIPSLDQPIQLVLNQEKAAHLGVQVHALSEEANDDTAEVLQGLYRRIEVDSRASLARSWAFERAVKCGRGAYRILTEYADDGGHFTDQKIVIKRLLYQEAAVFDPFAQEPDWSDGRWAFITSWVPFDRYKRKYKGSKLAAYGTSDLDALLVDCPDWITGDGEARAVLVAEYFRLEFSTKRRVQLDNGTDAYDDDIPEGRTAAEGDSAASRDEEVPSLKWSTINAVEELETEDRDGKYIPIIPVIGRELQPFDQERRWVGIIGPNKQAAQGLNYAASGLVEGAALEPKAPFDLDPREIEGYESYWNQANIRNFPYLPRKKFLEGQFIGEARRITTDTSKLQMNALLLTEFRDFLHSGTGAFEPTLGQHSPNVKTKGATLALQQQFDQGNSHFLDNLAEISLTYEAKVVLDQIPYVYDRPGRVARILDLEDNPRTVMLNQPFVMGPNKRPMPAPQSGPMQPGQMPAQPQQPQPEVKHYDLTKGRYGVTVSVGKAYQTRVQEGSDRLGQILMADPELFKVLGDIYLKFQDFPGHREAAERLKKALPPQFQDQDEQNAATEVPQLKAQLQQQGEQLKQAMGYIQKEQAKHDAAIAQTKIKASGDLQRARMDNATKLAVARISAAKESLNAAREDQEEAIALGQQQQHEATQGAMDRQHELNQAEQEHQHALEQAQQAHDHAVTQAEQGQQHALEQGNQSAEAAMAQQEQAAALAPEPSSNGAGA